MYKKIFIFIVLGIALFLASPVFAQVDELVVEYWSEAEGKWIKWLPGPASFPVFSETNFLPGQSITRWVKVTNNSGGPQRIAAEAINYPKPIPDYDLSRALMIVIKEGATDLYGGSNPTTGPKSLYDFYRDSETYSEIYLSGLENKKTTQYDFTISFLSETEKKEWQGATTAFDILIGFQRTAGQVPPGWGGGGVLPPGLTIRYEKDIYLTATTATIEWETSYDSTSQVIYASQYESYSFDLTKPNYGYPHADPIPENPAKVITHSVTITGLAAGTTYYYRCVSHASLAISTEHSFTTLGVKEVGGEVKGEEIIEGELAEGEVEGVGEKEPAFTEVTAGKEEEETMGGLEEPELVEVGTEEPTGLGKFLAAVGAFPFSPKVILIILALILIGLFILWLIKKKK